MTEPDLEDLLALLQEPAVARWWGDYDAARTRRELLEDPDVEAFVVEVGGATAASMCDGSVIGGVAAEVVSAVPASLMAVTRTRTVSPRRSTASL